MKNRKRMMRDPSWSNRTLPLENETPEARDRFNRRAAVFEGVLLGGIIVVGLAAVALVHLR